MRCSAVDAAIKGRFESMEEVTVGAMINGKCELTKEVMAAAIDAWSA